MFKEIFISALSPDSLQL